MYQVWGWVLSSRSKTHIRIRLDTPNPFWSAAFFISASISSLKRTVTPRSFLSVNSSGRGKKSAIRRALSKSTSGGSFVYGIFFFIGFLPFAPIARAEDSDFSVPVREPDGHDFATHFPKTKIAQFAIAVARIFKNNAVFIQKSALRIMERNTVLNYVIKVFPVVPFKIRRMHESNVIHSAFFFKNTMELMQKSRRCLISVVIGS